MVIGLALKLRTTLVVVVAALVTGLLAGLPLFTNEGIFQGIPFLTKSLAEGTTAQSGIINMLGKAFADNRLMTLFIITLPAIGLAERFGLQEQSARLIRRIRVATVGRLAIFYQIFRVLHGILEIRLNGHPAFVRPLIYPMAVGGAEKQSGAKSADEVPSARVVRAQSGELCRRELRQLLWAEPLARSTGNSARVRRDGRSRRGRQRVEARTFRDPNSNDLSDPGGGPVLVSRPPLSERCVTSS